MVFSEEDKSFYLSFASGKGHGSK